MALRAGVPDGRRRVRAVPPDRAAPPGHAPPAALRGAARPRRAAARPRRRALRRRAGAPRRGEPGHGRPHGRAGRRPPLARRHRARALLRSASRPLPPRSPSIGLDPRARLAAHRAGGPPPLGRRGHRPVGRHGAARACGPWARWPAPACTGPTGWPPTRCSRAWSSGPAWPSASRRAPRVPSRAARCGPCSAPSRIDGIGCTVLEHVGRAGRRPDADRWPGVDVTKLRDTVQRAMTARRRRRAQRRVAGRRRAVVEDAAAALGEPPASVARRRAGEPAAAGRRAAGLRARPAPRAGAPTPGASTPTPTRPGAAGSSTARSGA